MQRKVNVWTSIDWLTVTIYLILVIAGWLNIYAAVFDEEHKSILDISQSYGKQLIWIFAAFAIAIIILIIDSEFYSFFAYVVYGLLILLLISVLTMGKEVNGARSWFEIGSLRLQPAEFTKFATNLAVAKYLSTFHLKTYRIRTLIVVGILMIVPVGLIILQNDTGSALVYAAFIFVLYREGLSVGVLIVGFLLAVLFVLTLIASKISVLIGLLILGFLLFGIFRQRLREFIVAISIYVGLTIVLWILNEIFNYKTSMYNIYVASIVLSSIVYIVHIYKKKIAIGFWILGTLFISIGFTFSVDYFFNNVLEQHQQERISELLGVQSDPLGAGYNVNQSKIAIGSGGFFGKGFLQGTQTKYNFVPEQSTDFIFCTVGEEWGFLGTTFVIILFVFFLLRLIMLAERQRSTFSRVYGYGVVAIFFFHIVINIGMTIGLAPVIGIPLPFFSYGGSSLWAFTFLLFIFLRLDASRLELLR
ncbi:MAG TPA: rod shape-determining protein RodA [Bacteroidales bacterium]|nr:MAG: rod shape-determining protein RodA [Bacteroidetes bacterium GWF2_33_38]OFY88375.1 MAG: rod shape-determining protein RodA [Bacteroidetes bacterium RIFOXYA2_FULL_33_7]HBF88289.1 rod shape-determining protein RodA [Bacteroidales bacterium]